MRLDRGDLAVGEDVGMAPLHLIGDGGGDRVEVELAPLARHLGVEDDLEQQIAELVLQRLGIVLGDGIGDLVGLLDGVGRDGLEALLPVPRASRFGIAEPGHDVQQSLDRFAHEASLAWRGLAPDADAAWGKCSPGAGEGRLCPNR